MKNIDLEQSIPTIAAQGRGSDNSAGVRSMISTTPDLLNPNLAAEFIFEIPFFSA